MQFLYFHLSSLSILLADCIIDTFIFQATECLLTCLFYIHLASVAFKFPGLCTFLLPANKISQY